MSPIRYAPADERSEKALRVQGLEAIRAYPKYGYEEHQLREEQASHSHEYECMEQIARGLGLLVASEQEIQSYEESDRHQISCI